MDGVASVITIVKLTYDLALQVKQLIQNVKQRDENLEELEDKLDCLNKILAQAGQLCGSDKSSARSTSEREVRIVLRAVIIRCKNDLTKFEGELKKLQRHGNWASVAWRHQVAAPVLAKIERSISARQQHLSMLVQLLQGVRMDQIFEMLRTLTNGSGTSTPQSTAVGDQVADTDSMILQVTTALISKEASELEEDVEINTTGSPVERGEAEFQADAEGNVGGRLLLEAIESGDNDAFTKLLLDSGTSFKEKDSKDRTPLLLAAHLDRANMVTKLLVNNVEAKIDESSPLCNNGDENKGPENTSHRQIDFNATDNVGRTALHYCAEFDMCDVASLLLDHGVDVNARDNGGYTPAYFAAKHRKYFATKLLLERGAATNFEWPSPKSVEIEQLLRKYANNDPSASIPSAGPSGHSTVSALSP